MDGILFRFGYLDDLKMFSMRSDAPLNFRPHGSSTEVGASNCFMTPTKGS
jgi:hypothetical protein